ncbi:MAG: 5-formyltetrahydrofolate cyclo-ligase, partial [Alphaproteobacteria bacterium]
AEAPEFRRAARVGLYAPLPGEVPTGALLRVSEAQGKRVLWPRVAGPVLEFAASRLDELRPGRYGVAEPGPDAPESPISRPRIAIGPGHERVTGSGRDRMVRMWRG